MADQDRGETGRRPRNPADNLSDEARRKGGKNSAQMQRRDQHGQFAGRKSESSGNTGGNTGENRQDQSAGRSSGQGNNE